MKAFYLLLTACVMAVACRNEADNNSTATTASTTNPTTSSTPPMAKFTPYSLDSTQLKEVMPGLKIYLLEKGPGALPKAGQEVIVNYHGMFLDGRVFDSSFERGTPFNFTLGQGQVIKGWDEGIQRLPVGSKAVLVLSPEMAYGSTGAGSTIPPNTTLVFDVEVLGTMPATRPK